MVNMNGEALPSPFRETVTTRFINLTVKTTVTTDTRLANLFQQIQDLLLFPTDQQLMVNYLK